MSASPQMVLPSAGSPPAAPAELGRATTSESGTKASDASSFQSEMLSWFSDSAQDEAASLQNPLTLKPVMLNPATLKQTMLKTVTLNPAALKATNGTDARSLPGAGRAPLSESSPGLEGISAAPARPGRAAATDGVYSPRVLPLESPKTSGEETPDAKDTQNTLRQEKETDANAIAMAPVSPMDRKTPALPLHFALPQPEGDPHTANNTTEAASASAADTQQTSSLVEQTASPTLPPPSVSAQPRPQALAQPSTTTRALSTPTPPTANDKRKAASTDSVTAQQASSLVEQTASPTLPFPLFSSQPRPESVAEPPAATQAVPSSTPHTGNDKRKPTSTDAVEAQQTSSLAGQTASPTLPLPLFSSQPRPQSLAQPPAASRVLSTSAPHSAKHNHKAASTDSADVQQTSTLVDQTASATLPLPLFPAQPRPESVAELPPITQALPSSTPHTGNDKRKAALTDEVEAQQTASSAQPPPALSAQAHPTPPTQPLQTPAAQSTPVPPAQASPIPLAAQTADALVPKAAVPAPMPLIEELPLNQTVIDNAGDNSERKTPPMSLAFAARLDLDTTSDDTPPSSRAASDNNSAGEQKINPSRALPQTSDAITLVKIDTIGSAGNQSGDSGAAGSDPGHVRFQVSEMAPLKHASTPSVEKEIPAVDSKDQPTAASPSARLVTTEPVAAHVDFKAEAPAPAGKFSTPAPSNPNLQSEHGLESPPTPPTSSHDIRVQIPDDHGRSTEVRFVEAGGQMRVAVRTSDSELAQTLRSGLNELTSRLTSEGIQTEVWRPGSGASFQHNGSSHQSLDPNDSGSGGNGSEGRRRDDSQQDKPRWLQEMEASNGAPRP